MSEQPQSPVADVEMNDGTRMSISLPTFRQVIRNPDDTERNLVPLEDNAFSLETEDATISIDTADIESIERVGNSFRVRTANGGHFVGIVQMTALSRVVITGFAATESVMLPLKNLVRFTLRSQGDAESTSDDDP